METGVLEPEEVTAVVTACSAGVAMLAILRGLGDAECEIQDSKCKIQNEEHDHQADDPFDSSLLAQNDRSNDARDLISLVEAALASSRLAPTEPADLTS